MKLKLSISLFFISSILFSQNLDFDKTLIRETLITSQSGYYDIEKGKSIGHKDFIVYSKNLDNNKWQIIKYLKDSKNQKGLKSLTNKQMDSFFESFKSSLTYLTIADFDISENQFNNLTTEKEIRKIAKQRKFAWNFKKRYSTKQENEKIFNNYQDTTLFNKFLQQAFDTSRVFPIITDVWSTINISLVTNVDTIKFEGIMPNLNKLPWYNQSGDLFEFESILNPDINKNLLSILPNDFLEIESINSENLFYYYIIWYLKENEIE